MLSRGLAIGLSLVLAAAALSGRSAAQATDIHTLFESKCGDCHGHSGTFARESLRLEGERVIGIKTGRDAAQFLEGHHGRPSDDEIDRLIDAFRMQLQTGGLYEARCRICHAPAKELARLTLVMTDDGLTGRYSGRNIGEFLTVHGRLDAAEARVIHDMLVWQVLGP